MKVAARFSLGPPRSRRLHWLEPLNDEDDGAIIMDFWPIRFSENDDEASSVPGVKKLRVLLGYYTFSQKHVGQQIKKTGKTSFKN
ncbi:unnamed protein product [Clavelina lepadiformis]|uniref:Uncharacterized protein n=1 Tax=Clavelina lepadiformis TaxID=159417 RepID=A0ABP0GYS7_CLALP